MILTALYIDVFLAVTFMLNVPAPLMRQYENTPSQGVCTLPEERSLIYELVLCIRYCLPAIAVIIKRMLMRENRLDQDNECCNLYVHQFCGMFCVRRYQQFSTFMADSLRESCTVVCEWEC